MMYRFHTGYVAWLLNRATGILVIFYLAAHVWVTHHLSHGERAYSQVMGVLGSPLFQLLEIGLIGVVIYHMMNGIRVLLVDFGRAAGAQKSTFWVLMAIGVLLFVVCAWELAIGLVAPAAHATLTP